MNSIILLATLNEDGKVVPVKADSSTHGLLTIDIVDKSLADGVSFFSNNSDTLGSSGHVEYLLTTPSGDKDCIINFTLDGVGITSFDLYEAGNRQGVTPVVAFCTNRVIDTPPTMTIHKGITGGTTDGTLIKVYKSGSSQGNAKTVSSPRGGSLVLKRNTKYLMRVTSSSADNLTNTKFEWLEYKSL